MSFVSHSARPVDWPSPYSRSGRALGWVHFIATAVSSASLLAFGWLCYAVGFLAGLGVVVAFLVLLAPISALFVVGWLAHRLMRWVSSC